MLTKLQACNASEFHDNSIKGSDGRCIRWRRNGATQTWKTRPTEFRIPVKHGLYTYGNITDVTDHAFHVAEDCPFNR